MTGGKIELWLDSAQSSSHVSNTSKKKLIVFRVLFKGNWDLNLCFESRNVLGTV